MGPAAGGLKRRSTLRALGLGLVFSFACITAIAGSTSSDYPAVLRSAAESGDATSQVALGSLMMESLDNTVAREGVAWLEKAALQGAPVYVILGDAYKDGVGVEEDMTQAAKWYRLGAEIGDGLAQYEMAKLYLTGNGVETDVVKAFLYLKLADKRVFDVDRRRDIANLLRRARRWTSWEEWKRVEELFKRWQPKELQDLLN